MDHGSISIFCNLMMRNRLVILLLWILAVALDAAASIPRHDVTPDLACILSPRAPLLNVKTDHHNSTVQYRYDKAGGITNIVYPGSQVVTYGWDQGGRLTSVKDWTGRIWNFSYDGGNRLAGISCPNGVSHTRGYNADGMVTNWVWSKGGTPFVSRSFQRNAAGLKTRETISAGLEVELPDTWQRHTSDKADRLVGVSRRDEYSVPERWRGITPLYNREGQVTNLTEGYGGWSTANDLVWDDAGRLVEYTGLRQTNLWMATPPTPTFGLSLAYDGLGARTVRTDESQTHRLVVDRVGRLQVPLVETDSGNTPIRYYVWAPGIGLLAQIEASGTIRYFHADENGSTLAMTDLNGNVTDQFCYSPWGELLGRTGTNTTLFTFVGGGGVTWEGGALYKMGARYYDARLKRWLSSDPAGLAGGANLYLYANGNPLRWVDLLGLCAETYLSQRGPDWMYSDAPVEGPGALGSMVPVIGPMRQAAADRMNGNYGWMTVNAGFAMADVVSLGITTLARDAAGAGARALVRDASESAIREAAENSVVRGLATEADEAVFWSGIGTGEASGDHIAARWAAQNGGVTLESTLASRGIALPAWDASNPATVAAWRQASMDFATGARGNVRVLQGDALRVDSIWRDEFRVLQANPNVNSIRAISPHSGSEVLLWSR